jgi:hypothetical protein
MELLGSTIALDELSPAKTASPFESLTQSARTEFHAAMQLLAERAAFLTAADGVGIAVKEQSNFVYCVATGNDVPAAGSIADRVPDCNGSRTIFPMKSCDGTVCGFFELAGEHSFNDQDCKEIMRLTDLAGVALEHREAAERANSEAWEEIQASLAPVEWHAPVNKIENPEIRQSKPEQIAIGVKSCAACGFPVSPGRTLCVECELKSDAPVVASGELFSMQNQGSWISEHGYTVASLIVSALAVAVILWLRR